jgi:Universal stress protein family
MVAEQTPSAKLTGPVSQGQVRPIAGCAAIGERSFSRMTKGVRQPERYKVPPAWRPTAMRKTSKGLETERREGKEKEQVMTADEIIVGIDDSPSARAALHWAAAYARSTGAALPAIQVVDWPEAQDMCVYPVVAEYVYPNVSGWSVGVRQ